MCVNALKRCPYRRNLRTWVPKVRSRSETKTESFSRVTEQGVKRRPIQAQNTAIARTIARIFNDERKFLGAMNGHD